MDTYDSNEALKLDSQLCFPLYAAARKVTGLYTPFLKPLGLTYTQYLVFLVLWEQDSVSVSEICGRLFLDTGTVTPLLKTLEAEGYLFRARSSSDERCVVVSLTEKGRALKQESALIPEKVGRCIELDAAEAAMLYQTLYRILGKEKEETHE